MYITICTDLSPLPPSTTALQHPTSMQILTKYNRLRQLLAEANLEVAHAVRTIDDVPTRTELIQYERRFVELYQQVQCSVLQQ